MTKLMQYTLLATAMTLVSVAGAQDPAAKKDEKAPAAEAKPSAFSNDADKVGYAIGFDIGTKISKMKGDGAEISADALTSGMTDALGGKDRKMTEEESQKTMMDFSMKMQAKSMEKQKADGEKAASEGKKFLDENKAKEGVKVTASGLQYKVIKEGTGDMPKASDTVKTHYKGTLTDGKQFDSSYDRGEPATFPVGGVIKGWQEALQLMKVGSKWQLFIPSDLAYGPNGQGGMIPPNAVLVFDIELLSIEKAGDAK